MYLFNKITFLVDVSRFYISKPEVQPSPCKHPSKQLRWRDFKTFNLRSPGRTITSPNHLKILGKVS